LVASTLITVISAALLVYWFRYTCLLILRTRTGKDYATGLAEANGLAFTGVEEAVLSAASSQALASIERSLERDYRLLTYLLKQASEVNIAGLTLEQRMLMIDFWLMRAVFKLTRGLALSRSRQAVLEMTGVLNHLANAMGERVHAASVS
jgi:hypothetical protein